MSNLEKIRQERINKIKKLEKLGQTPYISFNKKKQDISKVRKLKGKTVSTAGRVFSKRGHGKLIFADLKDETGRIQLMFKYDVAGERVFKILQLLDIGDIVYVTGKVGESIRGEISIIVEDLSILTKSLRPLPEKWHGLKDVEERYRRRYVDLLVNDEVKQIFLKRTKVIQLLRKYLDKEGFVEVETPILQPIYGGATAKPFITHHNALDTDLYLRISDELYLKRLIVAGFEKVYEIGKDFRNEGFSRVHNPEFTMIEFYWAYVDYDKLMQFTEKLLSQIAVDITGSYKVEYQGQTFDLTPPWPRISYTKLFKDEIDLDLSKIKDEKQLLEVIKKRNLLNKDELEVGYANLVDKIYKKHLRPNIKGPVFLIDHPTELKPLAKRKEDNPNLVASFQVLIGGEEYVNAYNELNDPIDQKNRWLAEEEAGKRGAEEHQVVDEDYITALEYGMPPTAGWGLGVDRFTALLTNQPTIKDVILFPTLRPETND